MPKTKSEKIIAGLLFIFIAVVLANAMVRYTIATKGEITIAPNGISYKLWGMTMSPRNLLMLALWPDINKRSERVLTYYNKDTHQDLPSDLYGLYVWGKWRLVNPSQAAEKFFRQQVAICGYGRSMKIVRIPG